MYSVMYTRPIVQLFTSLCHETLCSHALGTKWWAFPTGRQIEEDGKTFVPDKRDGPITCEFCREEKFFQTLLSRLSQVLPSSFSFVLLHNFTMPSFASQTSKLNWKSWTWTFNSAGNLFWITWKEGVRNFHAFTSSPPKMYFMLCAMVCHYSGK